MLLLLICLKCSKLLILLSLLREDYTAREKFCDISVSRLSEDYTAREQLCSVSVSRLWEDYTAREELG